MSSVLSRAYLSIPKNQPVRRLAVLGHGYGGGAGSTLCSRIAPLSVQWRQVFTLVLIRSA